MLVHVRRTHCAYPSRTYLTSTSFPIVCWIQRWFSVWNCRESIVETQREAVCAHEMGTTDYYCYWTMQYCVLTVEVAIVATQSTAAQRTFCSWAFRPRWRRPLHVMSGTSVRPAHSTYDSKFRKKTRKTEFICPSLVNSIRSLPIAWHKFVNEFLARVNEGRKHGRHLQIQLIAFYELVESVHQTANGEFRGRIANASSGRFKCQQRCNRHNVTTSIGLHFRHEYSNRLRFKIECQKKNEQRNWSIWGCIFTQNCDTKLTFSTRITSSERPSSSDMFVKRPALFTTISTLPKSMRTFSRNVRTSS